MTIQKKTISIILVLATLVLAIFTLASCADNSTETPVRTDLVIDEEFANARILFLDYNVRYTSSMGNKEYITIGYVLPDDNSLHTTYVHAEQVIFTNIAAPEIRVVAQDSGLGDTYLYISEARFLELLK